MVLRQWRRNAGPKQPPSRVTRRPPAVRARQMVASARRRGWVEGLCRALKGGVGRPAITQAGGRGARAGAGAILAYLLRRKLRAQDRPADRRWSALSLQQAWEVMQAPGAQAARQLARQWLQTAQAA